MKPRSAVLLIVVLSLLVAIGPTTRAADEERTLTVKQRSEVIAALVQSLRTRYVLAEKGARVADEIEKQAAAGEFSSAQSPAELAKVLSTALWEASHDKHLRVMASENNTQPRRVVRRRPGSSGPAFEAEMLPGGVGLLTVNRLLPPAEVLEAAFGELAEADALIVDLRSCPGGGIGMPAAVASYMFDEPQLLLYMESRDGERDAVHTSRIPEGAPSFDGKPTYLTISPFTGSACEELAFDLKYHEKAILVGENTAGAGLGSRSGMADLGHGFEAFVPDMKPVHPRFDGGFEGVGVPPDVKVAATDAVTVAHVSALGALIDSTTDAARKSELENELTQATLAWTRQAKDRIASSRAHHEFTGKYDEQREIQVDGSDLYYVDGSRGIRGQLQAQDRDTFALQGSPGQLLRFERDDAGKVIGFRISEPGGEPWRPVIPRL